MSFDTLARYVRESIKFKIRFKKNFRLLHDKGHISLFNKKTLSLLLRKTGFKIVQVRYPFFKTKYFTFSNLLKLINKTKMSPPFYGNIITIYARKV